MTTVHHPDHFDPAEPDRYQMLRQIIQAEGSTFVSVKFIKVDGTKREFTFNPKDIREIKGTGKPCPNPNIFRVREINNKDEQSTVWRSFDARRVLSITSRGKTVDFT